MVFQPDNTYPWVLVRLQHGQYGMSARSVREMVLVDRVTSLPDAPDYVRGLLNLRGTVIPLLDLRVLSGMPSAESEMRDLVALLDAREKDHVEWLDELERCVEEEREFRLTTDPHRCAFGQWYDHFTTDNLVLSGVLRRFDEPHRAIHAIASHVQSMLRAGDARGARELIHRTRTGEMGTMIRLFETARILLKEEQRETAVVLEGSRQTVAAAADGVVSVEYLSEQFDPSLRCGSYEDLGLIGGIGRRVKDGTLVLLLDPGALFEAAAHRA